MTPSRDLYCSPCPWRVIHMGRIVQIVDARNEIVADLSNRSNGLRDATLMVECVNEGAGIAEGVVP